MKLSTKTYTIKEVYEAIAVDGYDHLRDDWVTFKKFDGKLRPLGACLVGMAAVNLGAVADSSWLSDNAAGDLRDAIFENGIWNEATEEFEDLEEDVVILGLADALDYFTITDIPEYLQRYTSRDEISLGTALISLNDARQFGDPMKYRYSFDELVVMAKEIMEPFFDKTIEVSEIDYTDANLLAV